jgi:hypothetical protein
MTSSASQRQRDRMRAATTRRTDPEAPATGHTAIRSKPVRITVDYPPESYRQLTQWTAAAAEELDVARVSTAAAIRAMSKLAATDPAVSKAVLDLLRRERDD